MKYIRSFAIFESMDHLSPITIERFLEVINIPKGDRLGIIDWWYRYRGRIKIYYFPFKVMGAYGCVFSDDSIAMNSSMRSQPEFMLYVALHETMHSDQVLMNTINPYFDKVVDRDYDGFMEAYIRLESEANDFAEASMRELGYGKFIDSNRDVLQQNLRFGKSVYDMISKGIQQYNPIDLVDFLRKTVV